MCPNGRSKQAGIPRAGSVGEETLALHLRAHKIDFQREVSLIPGRKWRVDFYIPRLDLAIEVEGGIWIQGRHNRASSIEADFRKYNALAMIGVKVLRYSTAQVESGEAIADVRAFLGHPSA